MFLKERAIERKRAAVDLALATLFAAFTAIGARLSLHLPFTPVPITGQVFCVLLAGAVLGSRLGFVSQVEYLAAGAAGLAVFTQGGGPAAMLGPTGGYLIGFPLAALAVGAMGTQARKLGRWGDLGACLCGVVIIYIFGAAWFAAWRMMTTEGARLTSVLAQAVYPFVVVDVVKAAAVAAIAPTVRRCLPMA